MQKNEVPLTQAQIAELSKQVKEIGNSLNRLGKTIGKGAAYD